jgi:hypothetical protein
MKGCESACANNRKYYTHMDCAYAYTWPSA